jgi:hypothetical protein
MYPAGLHYDMGYPYRSPPGRGTFYQFGSVVVGVGGGARQLQQLGRPFGELEEIESWTGDLGRGWPNRVLRVRCIRGEVTEGLAVVQPTLSRFGGHNDIKHKNPITFS